MSDYNAWDDPYLQYAVQTTGNLAQGSFQYAAQKDTNKTNRQIAAETNAANAAENEKNREFEREMWQKKAEFESPVNVRAMLEAAGINPYSAYGQQVNTPSSGSPSTHPMQGWQYTPQTGIAEGMKNALDASIVAQRSLAAARKDNADATSANIANITLGARLGAQLQAQGLDNAAQALDNELHGALNPLIVEGQQYQNEHTQSLIRLNEIQEKLQQFDLDWMKPSEYFRLQEDINLLIQKQKTEEELRAHYQRMDRNGQIANAIGWFNANTQRFAQQSQAGVNTALVTYYNAAAKKEEQMTLNYVEITKLNNLAARMKTTENDIYQEYAHFNAWYESNILRNKSSMSERDVMIQYQQYLMNQKHLNWYDAQQVVNTFIPIKYAFGKSSAPQTGDVPLWERNQNPYDPQPIGRPDANGFTPYGNGVFEDSRGWIYDAVHGTWTKPSP